MIIEKEREKKARAAEIIFTGAGWAYMAIVFIQIIISAIAWVFNLQRLNTELFQIGNMKDTIKIIIYTVIIMLVAMIVQISWSKYNALKYGKLNRRNFPITVVPKELDEYFNLKEGTCETFQNQKIIVLEKTIV